MSEGWLKIHRKMTEWEWYSDLPCYRLFTHLLLTANYKPTRFRGEQVQTGSKVIGLHSLAEQTGLTIQQLRTAIKKLQSTNEITIKSTNQFSIITVVNWSKYQEPEDASNKPSTNGQQTGNKPSTTSKEGKKERSKELSNNPYIPLTIPDWIPADDWSAFVEMRNAIKKPMTDHAIKLAIKTLEDLQATGDPPDKVLQRSIMNNWAGLFPLKNENGGSNAKHKHTGFEQQDFTAGTSGFDLA